MSMSIAMSKLMYMSLSMRHGAVDKCRWKCTCRYECVCVNADAGVACFDSSI